jgi:hypothetical protein
MILCYCNTSKYKYLNFSHSWLKLTLLTEKDSNQRSLQSTVTTTLPSRIYVVIVRFELFFICFSFADRHINRFVHDKPYSGLLALFYLCNSEIIKNMSALESEVIYSGILHEALAPRWLYWGSKSGWDAYMSRSIFKYVHVWQSASSFSFSFIFISLFLCLLISWVRLPLVHTGFLR